MENIMVKEEKVQVLKALANGINYFTGERCAEDSILNDPQVIRSLFEICDDLLNSREVIKKREFICPADIENTFEYSNSMSLTQIISKIAELYPDMQKLKNNQITQLLLEKGLLEEKTNASGRVKKYATESAKQYGITNSIMTTMNGQVYPVVRYNRDGQRFILSLLKEL